MHTCITPVSSQSPLVYPSALLFIISINDFPCLYSTSSSILPFADDTRCTKPIQFSTDSNQLETSLNERKCVPTFTSFQIQIQSKHIPSTTTPSLHPTSTKTLVLSCHMIYLGLLFTTISPSRSTRPSTLADEPSLWDHTNVHQITLISKILFTYWLQHKITLIIQTQIYPTASSNYSNSYRLFYLRTNVFHAYHVELTPSIP